MNTGPFFKQRKLQLEEEIKIDTIMKKLPCQEEVNRILFFSRQVNRRQTLDMSKIPSYNIPALWSSLAENLNEIDAHQKILYTVLMSDIPCDSLKYIFTTNNS